MELYSTLEPYTGRGQCVDWQYRNNSVPQFTAGRDARLGIVIEVDVHCDVWKHGCCVTLGKDGNSTVKPFATVQRKFCGALMREGYKCMLAQIEIEGFGTNLLIDAEDGKMEPVCVIRASQYRIPPVVILYFVMLSMDLPAMPSTSIYIPLCYSCQVPA